jgi:hypothetical protein
LSRSCQLFGNPDWVVTLASDTSVSISEIIFTLLKYDIGGIILNVWSKTLAIFLIDVLLTLAVINQAKILICNSSGKFQNDLEDQELMLATVRKAKSNLIT